jgi:hypothetical protein
MSQSVGVGGGEGTTRILSSVLGLYLFSILKQEEDGFVHFWKKYINRQMIIIYRYLIHTGKQPKKIFAVTNNS